MVMLPRLLYYFTNLPVVLPHTIFTTLNTLLITLIWGAGRRRISLQKLQLPPTEGGLGAPDFKAYYLSAQIQWLSYWTASSNRHEIGFTSTHINRGDLHTLLLPKARIPMDGAPLLLIALRCWKSAIKYTRKCLPYAGNIPLIGIPTPDGRLTTARLNAWHEAGVDRVGSFFEEGTLLTHDQFIQTTGAPTRLYLLHAMVTHYIKRTWAPVRAEPPQHDLVYSLYYMGTGAHLVRWLYKSIRTHVSTTLLALRETWAEDGLEEITDAAWTQILEHPRRVSRNTRLKFIQAMILHRAYLTPHKLHCMYPDTQHQCPRCKLREAGFLHMLWSCPGLTYYWTTIRQTITALTQLEIKHNPLECLLGLRKRSKIQKVYLRFIDLALILAIRNITIRWKSPKSPDTMHWKRDVLQWGKAEGWALRREE